MDLFHLKESVGGKFVTIFSHLTAGYSEDRATLFLKVNNESKEVTEKNAKREILIRYWQKTISSKDGQAQKQATL